MERLTFDLGNITQLMDGIEVVLLVDADPDGIYGVNVSAWWNLDGLDPDGKKQIESFVEYWFTETEDGREYFFQHMADQEQDAKHAEQAAAIEADEMRESV